MSSVGLVILGAGSVRCSPSVLTSLADYAGERPLDIRLYDPDEERLDLFDRFARMAFRFCKATHSLTSTLDFAEALAGAERVVLQMGHHASRRHLRAVGELGWRDIEDAEALRQASEDLLGRRAEGSLVLSLLARTVPLTVPTYRVEGWPPEIAEAARPAVPHQILRFIRGEEFLWEMLAEVDRSPLKAWLDDPLSLPVLPAVG